MQTLSQQLETPEGNIRMRNVAIHELSGAAEEHAEKLLASCQEISSAMPSKTSPTSLGATALEPGSNEKFPADLLHAYLVEHDLLHLQKMEGIEWRAKKLQIALERNGKLINPKLNATQTKEVKELLIKTAECLATRIEDLNRPCAVTPVDIPTSSPPIR